MTSRKKIDDTDKEVIRTLYEQGIPLKEIGLRIGGVTKQAVSYHVQKMGLTPPPDEDYLARKELTKELMEEDPSLSIKDVSEYLDCSWEAAKKVLVDLDLYEETVPFIERIDKDRLVHLYVVEDKSLADLAEIFSNVGELTISKTLKELDVPMRPQGASTGKIREEWRKTAMRTLGMLP